jgi:hypothetical protein
MPRRCSSMIVEDTPLATAISPLTLGGGTRMQVK